MNLFLFPFYGTDSERQKLRWLVSLRFYALVGIIIFTSIGIKYDYFRDDKIALYLASVIISIIVTSTSYFIWKKGHPIGQGFIFIQLVLDLFIFTAILFSHGGVMNPFVAVFYLHAILGGILLNKIFGRVFLGLILGSLAYVQFLTVEYLEFNSSSYLPLFLSHYFVSIVAWSLARSLQVQLGMSFHKLDQLKSASERMDRLRSLGALVAGLSHEFSSPLNTIKIQLERIIRKDLRPSEGDEHEMIFAAVERCSQVLKKMNSAQMDSKSYELEVIHVRKLIHEIIGVWKNDFPEAEVDLKGDETHLGLPLLNFTQVLLNLLDNSYEARRGPSRIEIDLKKIDKEFTILVRDNGVGFLDDVLKRFGEPFNSSKVSGTGLGLYSSLLFMNSLGGSLRVENLPESGAQVTMVFPVHAEKDFS